MMGLAMRIVRPACRAVSLALAGTFSFTAIQAADPLPQTPADLISKRALIGPGRDAFGGRPAVPAQKRAPAAVAVEVAIAPPAPPKLPFTYGGSGVVDGTPFLFLDSPGRSRMVHVGDTVDGAYQVESIQRNRAALRYLPLGVLQVMAFGQPGEPDRLPTVAVVAQGPLVVNVPEEAPLGREIPVAVTIPPGSAAAKATLELTYDAEALSVIGAKVVRPGRAVFEVSTQDRGASNRLRLKAIGEENALTEISIEAIAFDARGQNVPVRLPSQHIISLGKAN